MEARFVSDAFVEASGSERERPALVRRDEVGEEVRPTRRAAWRTTERGSASAADS